MIQDIIQKINNLNYDINQLESFLEFLENANIQSKYGKDKTNEFLDLEMRSMNWTGNDTCTRRKSLEGREILNLLSDAMKPILKSKIEEKKEKLSGLIKQ